MNINLHIERLVLDGVDIALGQGHLLQANVAAELTRLLNNSGLTHNLVESVVLRRLPTNSIQLTGNKPIELAEKIAQSVYGGIGHE